MSQYPWDNTTQNIAAQNDSRYETPGGAQAKADAALEDAKEYTDESLLSYEAQTGNIADDAVTADKIADGSITLTKLADLVVTAAKIANGTITEPKYATGSVSSRAIATGAVGASQLDPALLEQYGTAAINAKFELIDSKFNDISYNVKSFGCSVDGTTDDSFNFQNAIHFAEENGIKLVVSGRMLIKNQITINKALWIEGVGDSGHGHNKPVSTIIFDNDEVDVNGNATKSLFRIEEPYKYKLKGLTFKNLTIIHTKQTPKNQHTFFVNGVLATHWYIDNLTVYDATGAIFYLKSLSDNYTPELDVINWNRITGNNVGGIISQSEPSKTWVAIGTIKNIVCDNSINPVSPQSIICDFSGFRNVTFESILLQGAGAVGINTALKFTVANNTVSGLWVEYPINPPAYLIDTRDFITLTGISGVSSLSKIKGMGRYTVITIDELGINEPINNVVELTNGAQIVIKNTFSSVTSGSFADGDKQRLLTPLNKVGRIKIENATNFDGGTYNHNAELKLFSLTKGMPFRVDKKFNDFFETISFGPAPVIVPVYDVNEGRVLKLTPVGGNTSQIKFKINLPTEYIGSAITIGMRYKIETTDISGHIYVPYSYGDGVSANTSNGVINNSDYNYTSVNTLDHRDGNWHNGYISIGETNGDPILFFLTRDTNLTLPHIIYISDLQINLGNTLPALRPCSTTSEVFFDNQVPTTGYFVRGDLIHNTEPSILGTTGSKYTVEGWKRITTGTGNALNTDWVELRNLTGA